MHFDVVTLLPDAVSAYLSSSVLGRATQSGAIGWAAVDLRPFGEGRHRQVDDAPYGGGAGMVMAPGPIVAAIEHCVGLASPGARIRRLLMGPGGTVWTRDVAARLARDCDHLVLVCGRFEGVDARVETHVDEEISLGDFVLTGGELAALAVVDAVARLLPGVLGNAMSAEVESFEGPLLEHPQYTRPRSFRGAEVPDVLLSGDHAAIARWRLERATERTAARRPARLAAPDPER